jgi:predicted nucleic acid-binding protein
MIMIIADSSYIVQALLLDMSLFYPGKNDEDSILTPSFALYEVVNVIWKYQVLLKEIEDATPYLNALFELTSARAIRFLTLEEKTIRHAYDIAKKSKKTTFYDAAFVSLAIELDLELKTLDTEQERLYTEIKKQN